MWEPLCLDRLLPMGSSPEKSPQPVLPFALPEEPGESLEVEVALIRDLRACPLHDFSLEGQTDLVASHQDWQETPPSPASSTAARLIPIITTDPAPLRCGGLSPELYSSLGCPRKRDQR